MNNINLPYDAFLRAIKENKDINHALLLGAGASISSGVQSATDCIWEWKRNIFITKNPNLTKQYASFKSETVQRSLQKWLDTEGVYPVENSLEEYAYFAEKAYPIDETRRKYFENICKGKEPYIGYKILCQLSKRGLVRSVFTTNFDGLVERAAHQSNITPIPVSLATADYIHRASSNTELLCVALHGDFKYGPLKNTSAELDTQQDAFVTALQKHLYDKHLIVFGYSGRDKSLMDALKKAYSEAGGGMVFWCGYGHDANSNVQEFLEYIHSKGRSGYYVPTEGFDSTMIHIAKTCYEDDVNFQTDINNQLQNTGSETSQKTPFKLDVTEKNVLLRSNLLPILLPREVFQVEATFTENDKIWQTIKKLTSDKKVCSVPLKGCLYSFGTQSEIREAYANVMKGDIKRTPVTYKEIKEGTAFKNLYLTTLTRGISELLGYESDGKSKIWGTDCQTITKDGVLYKVYDALELGLFFDDKIFTASPYCYLSLNPTFYIKSDNVTG